MCGIVAVAGSAPVPDRTLLPTMRDTLRHRGPDDAGTWWSRDGRVGLASRRLAIIDLSPGANQPMADASGRFRIAYNGEIYNYRDLRRLLEARGHAFRTASDTEVILEAYRAWGEECVTQLNGMFAFALYDDEARRLFVARDRVGEKPLFYRHTGDGFACASELKALLADPAVPRELDPTALDHYLAYGYVPGRLCILRGMHKLPAAHALSYDLDSGGLRVRPYWTLPEPAPAADAGELEAELEALLEDSVRRRLIADVPVAILLSGGIDSSLVTALAARVSSTPVRTFTVSFPGHGRHDESGHARRVAEHFGTVHTEVVAEPATLDDLSLLARQYDEPMADSAMIPTHLVARVIRQHATVALSGDGGDELFAGYPHYRWLLTLERARRVVPALLRRSAARVASRWLAPGVRGRHHLIGFAGDRTASVAHVNLYFDFLARRRLLAPAEAHAGSPAAAPEAYRVSWCRPEHSALRQATEADFRTTLVDAYLVKVDRATMLHSVEMRTPWLDHRLVEFAFGRVPDRLRATPSELKILPRRLAARLLPPALDLTRKWGFTPPLAAWFAGRWGDHVEAVLAEADPRLFDRRVIAALVAGQRSGYANTARLFALTLFELWRREYRVALPAEAAPAVTGLRV